MKAKVNKETCIGCGLCSQIAPDDFILAADGKAEPKQELVKDEQAVRQAVADCPVSAISVEE